MNELEATRAKLKCLEMVEGTSLKWWEVVRGTGKQLSVPPCFSLQLSDYEFALGVVEGKPVWEGDTLWNVPNNFSFEAHTADADGIWESNQLGSRGGRYGHLLWNPPKPATKALSAFEQADLQKERDELFAALVKLYGAIEGLDWTLPGDMVVLNRTRAASACDSASKVIAKYYRGML